MIEALEGEGFNFLPNLVARFQPFLPVNYNKGSPLMGLRGVMFSPLVQLRVMVPFSF